MLIKVCGMAREDNAAAVAALGPDMIGFIFYRPSPRNAFGLSPGFVASLDVPRVGVFVDEQADVLLATARRYGLSHIQLHGEEAPETCLRLRGEGFVVLKAFGIAGEGDLAHAADYQEVCDMLVFDTKTPARGGSGRRFDHSVLAGYIGRLPFLLSGGIGPEDFDAASVHPSCIGLDVNSRFETAPGIKDLDLLGRFIRRSRGSE